MDNPKVSVLLPLLIKHDWQRHMTDCCIKTMLDTTDVPFELVIIESGTGHYDPQLECPHCDDADMELTTKYVHCDGHSNLVKDLNAGIEAATGDFLVHTGNDVFTRPGWLEALLEPFEKYPDCGVSCLAMSDLNQAPMQGISEGVYGPLMMFRNQGRLLKQDILPAGLPDLVQTVQQKGKAYSLGRFDESYENIFSDTDLIMRHYAAGFRSYRNWKVCCHHLLRQTLDDGDAKARFERYRTQFTERFKDSPHLMYRILAEGRVV